MQNATEARWRLNGVGSPTDLLPLLEQLAHLFRRLNNGTEGHGMVSVQSICLLRFIGKDNKDQPYPS